MIYEIRCKNCDYNKIWEVTLEYYEEHINDPCPKCKGKLYQDMSENTICVVYKGTGWTRGGVHGNGFYKKGSQEDLDDALRENDMLAEKADKDDNWRRVRETKDEDKEIVESKIKHNLI